MGGTVAGPGQVASLDAVLAGFKPKVARAQVCLRGDLIDELEQLEVQYRQAKAADDGDLGGGPWLPIAERIAQVQAEVDATSTTFVFESIGQRAWSDLIAAHPPTSEGKKTGEQFNPDSFPFAAVAASCVQPTGVDEEGARRLYDRLNFGQWSELWGACLDANVRTASVPKSAARSGSPRGSAAS